MFKINIKKISIFYLFLIIIFIYLPIISLIVFSFNETEGRISSLIHFHKFGLKWYYKIFTDEAIKSSIFVTFQIAFLSTIISTILGTLASISLMSYKKKWRQFILDTNQISIIIPDIINALALFVLFSFIHLSSGFWRMLLAHISFSTPFVLVCIYTKCCFLKKDLIEASYDLGATPSKTFFKIILPQLKSAILAGAGIAFSLSFDDYIISYFTGGSDYQNISAYIYSLKGNINPTINALSSVLISIIFIKIIFEFIKLKKRL
ncbi:ABC-type spermidine/putrescine transport system permease protein [Candidatus Phytoplasma luffae]|uniref:ABC-type spermidine/putrescine transport system permease protein n=1 Tax=Loofah witches'-broom phytoplasma TaxID=35773 RepID=A0A975IMA7_LOWBP|nr:ABC transporter permease [Candidatus Phytoplasma luffae]QTX03260.1 ABC-type spermidine/putrescine transport system permease protein [Candidatus Phytoplasma luffae]